MRILKLIRNKKKRQLINKNELKHIFLNFFLLWFLQNTKLLQYLINKINEIIYFMSLNQGFFTSVRNICLLSGRTRSVMSLYKLSRIKFNELMNFGYLPG